MASSSPAVYFAAYPYPNEHAVDPNHAFGNKHLTSFERHLPKFLRPSKTVMRSDELAAKAQAESRRGSLESARKGSVGSVEARNFD
jgi:hypothetical protein